MDFYHWPSVAHYVGHSIYIRGEGEVGNLPFFARILTIMNQEGNFFGGRVFTYPRVGSSSIRTFLCVIDK